MKANHSVYYRLFISVLIGLIIMALSPSRVNATATYNTSFLTDSELTDYTSMNTEQIRLFLNAKNSYFKNTVTDVDGSSLDLSAVIYNAAQTYKINPKILLATMQKEGSTVTLRTRPSNTVMKNLMGCIGSTARAQMFCAAKTFRSQFDNITKSGSTSNGWQVGTAKKTQDNILVTPATKAVATQFSYTPYAGKDWGGQNGGVALFYSIWKQFKFDVSSNDMDLDGYCKYKGYAGVVLTGSTVYDWKCKSSSGSLIGMDLYDACKWQYIGVLNVAKFTNTNDPYSWKCYIR